MRIFIHILFGELYKLSIFYFIKKKLFQKSQYYSTQAILSKKCKVCLATTLVDHYSTAINNLKLAKKIKYRFLLFSSSKSPRRSRMMCGKKVLSKARKSLEADFYKVLWYRKESSTREQYVGAQPLKSVQKESDNNNNERGQSRGERHKYENHISINTSIPFIQISLQSWRILRFLEYFDCKILKLQYMIIVLEVENRT